MSDSLLSPNGMPFSIYDIKRYKLKVLLIYVQWNICIFFNQKISQKQYYANLVPSIKIKLKLTVEYN